MQTLVTIIHVSVCLFLMLTVLLQSGKGGGMGAAFGGGTSQTVFGGSGAGNFLRKVTAVSAVLFMLTSMTLAYMASSTGADALKRYSAQQRQGKLIEEEARLKARETAIEGEEGKPGEGTDQGTPGEGVSVPEGTTPEGAAPTGEGAGQGATDTQGTPGAQPGQGAAPAGAGQGANPPAGGQQPASAPASGGAPAQEGAAQPAPGAAQPAQGAASAPTTTP